MPAAEQFTVHAGTVVYPEPLGWLHEHPQAPLDAVVADRLQQAQIAEFARGDATAALAQFDELLGPQGPTGDAALPCLLAAAWAAHRAGDTARSDLLAARRAAALAKLSAAGLAQPELAAFVAGSVLLDAARGQAPAPALTPLLQALPERLTAALFARLHERGQPAAALATAAAAIQQQRRRLVLAQGLVPQFDAPTLARAADGQLVLWFADPQTAGNGRGAVTRPEFLHSLVAPDGPTERAPSDPRRTLPAVPSTAGLTFLEPTGDHEVVVPGLAWVAPAAVPEPHWLARPAAVVTATLALVFVFGGSLWFAARALRRETLAIRARSDFLTGVTHELKTPIASIRLVAEVLSDDEVPAAKQLEYFALLAGESARLSMLIENVLDLGQMERGERAYDLRPGDLAQVVRDAVRLFGPLAQRAGLQLEVHEGAGEVPATIDQGALLQALLAVFENARKYAAAGGQLTVTTAHRGDQFTIDVRDFGPGVPTAERDAVFERFQRGRAHRHGSIPGTGLGLYLARSIVARHGGTLVCLAPADGPGARFRFTLPTTLEASR